MPREEGACPTCEMSALSQSIGVYCGGVLSESGFCYFSENMLQSCAEGRASCVAESSSAKCAYHLRRIYEYGQCPDDAPGVGGDAFCVELGAMTNLRSGRFPKWCNSVRDETACASSYLTYPASGAADTVYHKCQWKDGSCAAEKGEEGESVVYPCASTCEGLHGRRAIGNRGRCHAGTSFDAGDRLGSREMCEQYYQTAWGDLYPCEWRMGTAACTADICVAGHQCTYACNCIAADVPCREEQAYCCAEGSCRPCAGR